MNTVKLQSASQVRIFKIESNEFDIAVRSALLNGATVDIYATFPSVPRCIEFASRLGVLRSQIKIVAK